MIDKLNPIKESTIKKAIPERAEISRKEGLERRDEIDSQSTSEYIKQLEEKIHRLEETIKEIKKEREFPREEKAMEKDREISSDDYRSISNKSTSDDINNDIKKQVKRISSLSEENQIETLCDLAFQKGLDFAVDVAKGLNNSYVLDEFHDRLVDEFYQKLIEEGKLEKM
ncbi:hypothetical protein J7J12_00370 [bacterium]|nr:hypothetical protein [bacterium]